MARLNENENENESSGGSRDGLFAGARYNTHKILKQAFNPLGDLGVTGKYGGYVEHAGYVELGGAWDVENRGWIYIADFKELRPTWFDDLLKLARDTWSGWDAAAAEGDANLDSALRVIVDAAGEREDRFAEILHQRDAEGCISYCMGMLRIDPGRQPNTCQLIRVGRKLGEDIVMCLKARFDAPRPSQLSPAVIPMFDPPCTAAYPAGHALQSYLIAYLLRRIMPQLPQSKRPEKEAGSVSEWETQHYGLFALARRISDNRTIAGVHYDIDNKAGFLIAQEIDKWFGEWEAEGVKNPVWYSNLGRLLDAAKAEFPQWNERSRR